MSKRDTKEQTKDLLKKAAQALEEQPEEPSPADAAPPSQDGRSRSGLPADRRRALISYMAILFAVAFLLVALSLAVQYRDSQNTISQLGDSAKTALEKVSSLQEDNLLLQKNIQDLEDQMDILTEQLQDAQTALTQQSNEGDVLEGANQELLQEKLDAENRAEAYQLLARALEANARGDAEDLQAAMSSLEAVSAYLDSADLEIYRALLSQEGE